MKENNPSRNLAGMLATDEIGSAIRVACDRRLGVLDSHFMCRSVAQIPSKTATCASPEDSVKQVLTLLREHKTGCVVIVNEVGVTQGIFSERDFILKISADCSSARMSLPIKDFMTREPMTVTSDCTLAFALNLMSQGGFRHIPIVDEMGRPNSVLSVKDVVDVIVSQFVADVLALEVEE